MCGIPTGVLYIGGMYVQRREIRGAEKMNGTYGSQGGGGSAGNRRTAPWFVCGAGDQVPMSYPSSSPGDVLEGDSKDNEIKIGLGVHRDAPASQGGLRSGGHQ